MSYSFFPTPKFKKQVKDLQKLYRSIGDDLNTYLNAFEEDTLPGEAIPEFSNRIFKDRIRNTDIQKGKSGGYRIVYYVDHADKEIYFLCIYSKNQQENILSKEIRLLLKQLDL